MYPALAIKTNLPLLFKNTQPHSIPKVCQSSLFSSLQRQWRYSCLMEIANTRKQLFRCTLANGILSPWMSHIEEIPGSCRGQITGWRHRELDINVGRWSFNSTGVFMRFNAGRSGIGRRDVTTCLTSTLVMLRQMRPGKELGRGFNQMRRTFSRRPTLEFRLGAYSGTASSESSGPVQACFLCGWRGTRKFDQQQKNWRLGILLQISKLFQSPSCLPCTKASWWEFIEGTTFKKPVSFLRLYLWGSPSPTFGASMFKSTTLHIT